MAQRLPMRMTPPPVSGAAGFHLFALAWVQILEFGAPVVLETRLATVRRSVAKAAALALAAAAAHDGIATGAGARRMPTLTHADQLHRRITRAPVATRTVRLGLIAIVRVVLVLRPLALRGRARVAKGAIALPLAALAPVSALLYVGGIARLATVPLRRPRGLPEKALSPVEGSVVCRRGIVRRSTKPTVRSATRARHVLAAAILLNDLDRTGRAAFDDAEVIEDCHALLATHFRLLPPPPVLGAADFAGVVRRVALEARDDVVTAIVLAAVAPDERGILPQDDAVAAVARADVETRLLTQVLESKDACILATQLRVEPKLLQPLHALWRDLACGSPRRPWSVRTQEVTAPEALVITSGMLWIWCAAQPAVPRSSSGGCNRRA